MLSESFDGPHFNDAIYLVVNNAGVSEGDAKSPIRSSMFEDSKSNESRGDELSKLATRWTNLTVRPGQIRFRDTSARTADSDDLELAICRLSAPALAIATSWQ